MVVEAAGGILSGSLALLADAGHMLADTAALALAWLAFRMSRKPADTLRSYGYQRLQVLAALINGIILFLIVVWIGIEAIRRLFEPVEVLSGIMATVAGIGLLINILAFAILHGADHQNLNLHAALLHVVGDLLGSIAALTAAGIILWSGWTPIDPLLSLFVAFLILRSAWLLIGKSVHILLEGTPEWLDIDELRLELKEAVPAVENIHHVHVWSLSSESPLLTLHASVCQGTDYDHTLIAIKACLRERYGISHSTVQIETHTCADHGGSPMVKAN
jgi:cobalt-zinc-cadmium efflux system protein